MDKLTLRLARHVVLSLSLLTLAACGGGGGGGSGPSQVADPNVAGDTQAAATAAITAAGLTVGTITMQASSTVAAGDIISENPVAGTAVSRGSVVNLIVSSGPAPVSVPNVVGDTQAAATAAITGAGLTLGTVTMQSSSTVTSGTVISESPAAGTTVARSSVVELVVSSGAPSVSVPNVMGESQAGATTALTAAGLVVGTISQQSSSTVASGSVISESPAAGSNVATGSAVNLVVSSGKPPVAVPNVVGETQATASTAITSIGLVVGTISQQSSSTVASGSVISESPAAGTEVASSSAVALTISSGPAGGVWIPVASLHVARGSIGVASLNGKLYALGGVSNPNNNLELTYFDNLESYDPSTKSWTELRPFPGGGIYGVALVGINGLLYAFGGYLESANGGAYYSGWCYDPANNQWQPVNSNFPSFPTGYGGMGVATDGTSAYLVGGFDAINFFNNAAFLYNPQNGFSLLPINTPYVPLANPAVGWVNGSLVVAPGYTANLSPVPSTVYVDDAQANSWSAEAAPFAEGGSQSVGAVIGTTFYVVAGNSLTAFDIASDTWTPETPLPAAPVVYAEGVAAIDGVLYAVGGLQQVGYNPGTSAVWAYTP